MSAILGPRIAYGELVETGLTRGGQGLYIASMADDLRAAGDMLYRRVAVLRAEDLEALAMKAAQAAGLELELAELRRQADTADRSKEAADEARRAAWARLDDARSALDTAGVPTTVKLPGGETRDLGIGERIDRVAEERDTLRARTDLNESLLDDVVEDLLGGGSHSAEEIRAAARTVRAERDEARARDSAGDKIGKALAGVVTDVFAALEAAGLPGSSDPGAPSPAERIRTLAGARDRAVAHAVEIRTELERVTKQLAAVATVGGVFATGMVGVFAALKDAGLPGSTEPADRIRALAARVTAAEQAVESRFHLGCSACGSTAATMAEVRAHVEACPLHPMGQLAARATAAELEVERLRGVEAAARTYITLSDAYDEDEDDDNGTGAIAVVEAWRGLATALSPVPEEESVELLLPADAMDELEERTCRACGCTDDWGCDGGCSWAEEDLCSECVDDDEPEPSCTCGHVQHEHGDPSTARGCHGVGECGVEGDGGARCTCTAFAAAEASR